MTQWEYNWSTGGREAGVPLADVMPKLVAMANEYGTYGWEMVNLSVIVTDPEEMALHFISLYKRPVRSA